MRRVDKAELVYFNILCYNRRVNKWHHESTTNFYTRFVSKKFRSLHTHFIPSHLNGYQPYFLRLKIAAGILGLVLGVEALYLAHTFLVLPQSDYFAAIFATVLVEQTNQSRITENMSTLSVNTILERAAQLKADDMASKSYFAHNSPDGKTPWYFFNQVGYDYAAAGENLAVNFTDSKDITEAWMHSPAHRANIMNGNYTEIGIATARGVYKGKDAIFVVQEFGRPSLIARQLVVASGTARSIEEMIATATHTPTPPTVIKQSTEAPIVAPKPKPPFALNVAVASSSVKTQTTIAPEKSPPSTIVAGAETQKLDIPVYPVNLPILERSHVSKLDLLLASPRQATSTIYLLLAAIILFALGLAVFVKIRVQYPHIIANGILLVAIILSLVVLNQALGFTQGVI